MEVVSIPSRASQDLFRETNDAVVSFTELLAFQFLDAVTARLPTLCRCMWISRHALSHLFSFTPTFAGLVPLEFPARFSYLLVHFDIGTRHCRGELVHGSFRALIHCIGDDFKSLLFFLSLLRFLL